MIDLNKNKTAVLIFWRMSAAAFFIYKKNRTTGLQQCYNKSNKTRCFLIENLRCFEETKEMFK
ncbi:hypothetical protein D920_00914 [Enterococcus faecalis 13-SD-W-01]|nr:hypothetical protein D920_00914 [Enterococcus faecalis 13-SD-W-01]